MFRYGTIHDWWEASREHDCLRYLRGGQPRKCVLKCLGYAFLLTKIRKMRPARILEFGHGPTSPLFDRLGADVELWGLDAYSTTDCYLPRAYDDFRKAHPNAHFRLGYFGRDDLDLPENYFDMVCSVSVVEHVAPAELDRVFGQIRRHLRPGGVVVNSTDIYHGQDLSALYEAHVNNGFTWLDDTAVPEPRIDPHQVMMEDPRAVLEVYLQHEPVEQRAWPGNFLSLLSAARKAA